MNKIRQRPPDGKVWIYRLADPETGRTRYIGCTVRKPHRRMKQHCAEARRKDQNTHRLNWLRKVQDSGAEPIVEILACVPEDVAEDAERRAIEAAKGMDLDLVNETSGGDGTRGLSEAARRRRSRKLKEYYQNNEHHRKGKEPWNKGISRPKISEMLTGENNPMKNEEVRDNAREGIALYYMKTEDMKELAELAGEDHDWSGYDLPPHQTRRLNPERW